MTGIADCLIKEDTQAVSAGGKKETVAEAGLFAALLGGKVLLADAKKMPLSAVPDEPTGRAPDAGAETETVDSLLMMPLNRTKKNDKARSGLSDTEIFYIAGLDVEPPKVPEALPKKLLNSDVELQMMKTLEDGSGVNETFLASQSTVDVPAKNPGASVPSLSQGFSLAQSAELPVTNEKTEGFSSAFEQPVPVRAPAISIPKGTDPLGVSAEPQRTVSAAVGAPPESQELPAEKTANAVQAAAVPANQPAADLAPVASEVAAAAPAAGLIQIKESGGKRTDVLSVGKTVAAVELGEKTRAGTVPAGSSAQEAVRPALAAKAGGLESLPVTDASFVRLVAESVEKPDAARRRGSRTSIDPVAGSEPAALETGRTAQLPPTHTGAAAAPASDSRAADLQKLMDTFDRHMLSMVKQGEKTTRVILDSREMGRLTVVCREEISGLKIEIQAQSAAVQAALQRHEPALRQLLQSHGSAVGKFDVTCDDGRGADPRRFSRERNGFGEAPDDGIEPAYLAINEVEIPAARASAHAVSIFA